MDNDDTGARADELTALASIYGDRIFAAEGEHAGQFSAHLELPADFFVRPDGSALIQQASKHGLKLVEGTEGSHLLRISHLPPIVLNFQYPEDYPSVSAPSFTLSCKWLSVAKLSELRSHLDRIWDENRGEVIIFQWTQFLVDESLQVLGIQSPLSLDCMEVLQSTPAGAGSACVDEGTSQHAGSSSKDLGILDPHDITSAAGLLQTLTEHDRAERQRVFDASVHNCLVCFCDKAGLDCIDFQGCNHVYCKECVTGYFQVQIREGNLTALNCPDTECDSSAMPSQVRELVGEELFATYDRLLLQRTLERMHDIVYCPRLFCQCPVMRDNESSLAVCSACAHAFCALCMMTYHGVSHCKPDEGEISKFRRQFEEGDEECRVRLEKRFGEDLFKDIREEIAAIRRQQQLLEDERLKAIQEDPRLKAILEDPWQREMWEKERLKEIMEIKRQKEISEKESPTDRMKNQTWKVENTKQCPMCHTHIEKAMGCDMMTCRRPGCDTLFCWKCLQIWPHQWPCGESFAAGGILKEPP